MISSNVTELDKAPLPYNNRERDITTIRLRYLPEPAFFQYIIDKYLRCNPPRTRSENKRNGLEFQNECQKMTPGEEPS